MVSGERITFVSLEVSKIQMFPCKYEPLSTQIVKVNPVKYISLLTLTRPYQYLAIDLYYLKNPMETLLRFSLLTKFQVRHITRATDGWEKINLIDSDLHFSIY